MKLLVLSLLLFCVFGVEEPEPKPGAPVCDNPGNIIVDLITQAGNDSDICAKLVYFLPDGTIPLEDMCGCFTNENLDKSYLYSITCRLTSGTEYITGDVAKWCNGEEEFVTNTDATVFSDSLSDFDMSTFEGAADYQAIGTGENFRRTFSGYDANGDSLYLNIKFAFTPVNNWQLSDELVLTLGYDGDVSNALRASDMDEAEDFHLTIPLSQEGIVYDPEGYYNFTLEFTSSVSESDASYTIEMTELALDNKQEQAEQCRGDTPNPGTEFYPVINLDETGFCYVANDSKRIYPAETVSFVINIPRYFYDVKISFDGAANDLAGYDMDRTYDENTDASDETFWRTDSLTLDDSNCGDEEFKAQIPWTVLNAEESGGIVQLESYGNQLDDTSFETITVDENHYLFGGKVKIDAKETVYTEDESGNRDWYTERVLSWTYPFLVKWERKVTVSTFFEFITGNTTIQFVAAMVSYEQKDLVYDLADSNSGSMAYIEMDLHTVIRYPYLLVTGQQDDDPPQYWIDSVRDYPGPFLDEMGEEYWYPPKIVYTPGRDGLEVNATVSFSFEETAECTTDLSGDITLNDDKSCAQEWKMQIYPLNGGCYVDGDYTIYWSLRCFYEKPTCIYHSDDSDVGTEYNTVSLDLNIISSNMCPVVVHEVDVEGKLCITGSEYMRCSEYTPQWADFAQSDDMIDSFFSDNVVHFFLEIGSQQARIVESRIIQIWIKDPNDDSVPATTLYDDDGSPEKFVHGAVVDVSASGVFTGDDWGQGSGSNDEALFTGFSVDLSDAVFPVEGDSFADFLFEVTVEVLYEGFVGEDGTWTKPSRRRVLVQSVPTSGSEFLRYDEILRVYPVAVDVTPCLEENDQVWVFKMPAGVELEEFGAELMVLADSNAITLEYKHAASSLDYVVVTPQDPTIFGVLKNTFEQRNEDFLNTVYTSTLKQATCLDIPEGETFNWIEAIHCAGGGSCTFYGDETLQEWRNSDSEDSDVSQVDLEEPKDSAAVYSTLLAFVILFILV